MGLWVGVHYGVITGGKKEPSAPIRLHVLERPIRPEITAPVQVTSEPVPVIDPRQEPHLERRVVGKPVKVPAARIQTNVVPTLASTCFMRCNCIQPFIECAEFRHPDRGFLLSRNIFAQAYGVQPRHSRQFLADDVDESPVNRHLGSMRFIGNVLAIPAKPAFLLPVTAKLPQKLPS